MNDAKMYFSFLLLCAAVGLLCVALFVATRFFRLNRKLKTHIEQREPVEAELRALEQGERATSELLETVLANMAHALVVVDADLLVVAYNDRFKRIFNFSDTDIHQGASFDNLIKIWAAAFDQDQQMLDRSLAELRRRDSFYQAFPQYHPEQGLTWIELYHNPLPQGGFVRTFTDITERKRAETMLAASEKRYHALVETAPLPSVITSLEDNRFLYLNTRAEEFLGVAAGEAVGKSAQLYYKNPEDRVRLVEIIKREGRVSGVEVCLRTEEGLLRWVTLSATLTTFADIPVLFASFNDITERKLIEERLAESEEFHRAIIDAAPVGILVADNAGKLIFYSQKAGELHGVPPDVSMLGTPVAEWVHPDDRERAIARFGAFFTGELAVSTSEYRLKRYNGDIFWAAVSSTLFHDASGRPKGVLSVTMDQTTRKQMEAELWAAKEAAEAANRAKSEFLTNMSHEIRTPMNAIVGLSQLCLSTMPTPKQKAYLTKILAAADTLLALVNDILDLSKIEAGKMDVESALFNFDRLWCKVEDILGHKAMEKGLAFTMTADPDIPALVRGDSLRLLQILLNLGGNAIKFTAAGEVRLNAELQDRDDDKVRIRFSVQDTGPGMDDEILERLFHPFTQADGSITRKYGGAGLGLAICKHLAEMMGGAIDVSSAPGKGSLFSVSLVFGAPGRAEGQADGRAELVAIEPPPGPVAIETLAGARVLLVEDNEINMLVAREMLEQGGVQVTTATNGREALDILAGDPGFDAVLLDIQMPVLDGYDTARTIRDTLGLAELPIIAMTAHAFDSEREKCFAAGMNDHLAKPVKTQMLLETLAHWIKRDATSEARSGATFGVSPIEFAPSFSPDMERDQDSASALDLPALQQRLGADAGTVSAILRQFRKEYCDTPTIIRDCLSRGDIETAKKNMHALKGVAGNLVTRPLAEAVEGVDAALRSVVRQEREIASLDACLAQFETQLGSVCAAIDRLDDADA